MAFSQSSDERKTRSILFPVFLYATNVDDESTKEPTTDIPSTTETAPTQTTQNPIDEDLKLFGPYAHLFNRYFNKTNRPMQMVLPSYPYMPPYGFQQNYGNRPYYGFRPYEGLFPSPYYGAGNYYNKFPYTNFVNTF